MKWPPTAGPQGAQGANGAAGAQGAQGAQGASTPAIGCKVSHNAAQTLTDNITLALAFNTEVFDTDAMHDTVTNNSRITMNTAGVYFLQGQVEFVASAVGIRQLQLRQSGATIVGGSRISAAGAGVTLLQVTAVVAVAVAGYYELMALQTSGGNLDVNSASAYTPRFQAIRLSD